MAESLVFQDKSMRFQIAREKMVNGDYSSKLIRGCWLNIYYTSLPKYHSLWCGSCRIGWAVTRELVVKFFLVYFTLICLISK